MLEFRLNLIVIDLLLGASVNNCFGDTTAAFSKQLLF